MDITNELLAKYKKRKLRNIIIAAIFLLGGIAASILGYTVSNKKIEPISFHEHIVSENPKKSAYVYVDVNEKPYLFATHTVDKVKYNYYIILDKDYMYIAKLNDKTFKKLDVDSILESPIRITGLTYTIPSDAKRIALDAYKDSETINSSTFHDYFGYDFIDVTKSPNDASGYYITSSLLGIIMLIIVFVIISQEMKNKKTLKKYSENDLQKIYSEYTGKNFLYSNKNETIVLTNNYIINNRSYLEVIKYDDIAWIYEIINKYNGVPVSSFIKVFTTDGKAHIINSFSITKKETENKENFMSIICDKNKKALVGFTPENRKQAREMYNIKA